jgi:peptidoglycan/xylan/chitin deacetylase (PgdA/CDA1 family)
MTPKDESALRKAQTAYVVPSPKFTLASRHTPPPTPEPEPAATPVPGPNAPWYADRNANLRAFMQCYDPQLTDADIDEAVNGMFIDPDKPMVALTFDDGPVPGVTDQILDILERYHARATFFVCGWRFGNEEVCEITRRAIALGCEIGNHTLDHKDMLRLNIIEKRMEIGSTNKAVFEATGYVMRDMRPPGGHLDWDVNRVARENGMAVVLWSQSGNVNEYDPAKIAQNVQKQIVDGKELHDGDIILLHDTKAHMVDAVEIIVPQLLDQGYQLVTVWELLNCSQAGFTPGTTYRRQ